MLQQAGRGFQCSEEEKRSMMKFLGFLFVFLFVVMTTCFENVVVVNGFTHSRYVSLSSVKKEWGSSCYTTQNHLGSSYCVAFIAKHQKRVPNTMTQKQKILKGSPTVLFNSGIDGTTGRGPIILGLTLLVTIWIFTIPPEFRRAYICSTDSCVANRSACKDCQTIDELKEGIIAYYKNGGGIQFDFSIDPATIAKNEQTVQGILRK